MLSTWAADVTIGGRHSLLDVVEPAEPLAPAITDRPRREVDAVAAVLACTWHMNRPAASYPLRAT